MSHIFIFGGSFNPPHMDHYRILEACLTDRHCDEVRIYPAVNHAFDKDLAPFEDRKAMVEAMVKRVSNPFSKKVQVVRNDARYTADILEDLRRQFPYDIFTLVLGSDILNETEKWQHWEQVCKLARPLVFRRPGVPIPEGTKYDICTLHENRGLSSTDIRERLSRLDFENLVGRGGDLVDDVFDVIRSRGLYGVPKVGEPSVTSVATLIVPLQSILDKVSSGHPFHLTGTTRSVLQVTDGPPQEDGSPTVRFLLLEDTRMRDEHLSKMITWETHRTEARRISGREYMSPRPILGSIPLMYAKVDGGATMVALSYRQTTFVGVAGGYAFFSQDVNGGLFGGLI